MKKNNLLLALLASSLILTSCGGDDKPADQSGKENETSQAGDSNGASVEPGQTTEPEISVDTRTNEQKVKDLFALMAEGKTSTFEYSGYKVEYYGDDKGIWNVVPANDQGYTDYGTAVIPNYGIYSVAFDEDADEMYLSQIISPNKALKISDVAYTTKDLGTAASTLVWSESSRTHTFSTTDTTFCGVLMCILGLNDYVEYFGGKKASFQVSDDGSAITNLTLDLSNPTTTQIKATKIEGMKIYKVGSTMNLDFEVVFTNPSISARTAWTQYELAYFTTYLHPQFTLPFPTGATYAVNVTVLDDGSFYFEDLGCGNLVNSYTNQLTAAGFTLNDDKSDTTKGVYCYEKTLVAATDTSYAIKEYVLFTWSNSAQQATIYPNGSFMIVAYAAQDIPMLTEDELTTALRSHTLSDGTIYWPNTTLGNCTGATLEDTTAEEQAQYPNYTQEFFGTVTIYYATEADAVDAYNTICEQLQKNNYYYYQYYDVFVLESDYGDTVLISIHVAYDNSNNYLGYILIEIDSYA